MNARGACLIAGCGDVGSRLGALLVARGETVYGLRRTAAQLPAGVTAVRADLTDPSTLRDLPAGITRLVYLPTPGAREENVYRDVYLHGLHNLLGALRDRCSLQRVLFASSSAVYGEHGGDWVDEDTPSVPLAFNGAVLLEAERWLADQPENTVALRLSGLYGPGRTRLIELVASGVARTPPGARQWTHRVHVEDAAAACAHVLDLPHPAGCYIVSDDAPAGMDEVYAFLAQRLGVPLPPVGEAAQERAVGNKRLSNARLKGSGFVFRYPDFRAGYAELVLARPA